MVYTHKFNKDCKIELSDLRDSKLWDIKTRLESGAKLSLDDKVWLNNACNTSAFTPRGMAALLGWGFDFTDHLKRYVYLQYGAWSEYWAVDKTSLRKSLCGGGSDKAYP